MVVHDFSNSAAFHSDVKIVFEEHGVEVWAVENEHHGVVGRFQTGRDAAQFVWQNYRKGRSHNA